MPRISREFVKLETRLINDPRFFRLSEFGQLLYVKLLALSKVTNNRIDKDLTVIRDLVRTERLLSDIEVTIKEIKTNFPKFRSNKHFMYFADYGHRYKKGVGNPCVDEEEDKDEDIDSTGTLLSNPLFKKAWQDFLTMRRTIRKPATLRAKQIIIKDLYQYALPTAVAMLEQSIVGSWQGVFPLKTALSKKEEFVND